MIFSGPVPAVDAWHGRNAPGALPAAPVPAPAPGSFSAASSKLGSGGEVAGSAPPALPRQQPMMAPEYPAGAHEREASRGQGEGRARLFPVPARPCSRVAGWLRSRDPQPPAASCLVEWRLADWRRHPWSERPGSSTPWRPIMCPSGRARQVGGGGNRGVCMTPPAPSASP